MQVPNCENTNANRNNATVKYSMIPIEMFNYCSPCIAIKY